MAYSYGIMVILLFVLVAALSQGISASNDAASAIHQIYSVLWYLIAVVCLVGVGIMHMISLGQIETVPTQKPTTPVGERTASTDNTHSQDISVAYDSLKLEYGAYISDSGIRAQLGNSGFTDSDIDAILETKRTK